MATQIMTLRSTDIQILDEDFITINTSAGYLALDYEQMLDLIAQFSKAVEKMDQIAECRLNELAPLQLNTHH